MIAVRRLRHTAGSLCLAIFWIIGCASAHTQPDTGSFVDNITDGQFNEVVDLYTKQDQQYDGFVSAFQYYATLLNSKVLDVQVARKASDFQWTREALAQEREKTTQSLGNQSQIFLSFFAPVNENDNLESSKTLWKVYLVSRGTRYDAHIMKTAGPLAQFQRIYPHHSRYATPYVLTFPVPMTQIQQAESKLIITGPVGTSEVAFPSAQ